MSDPSQVPLPTSPVMVDGHEPVSPATMGFDQQQQATYDQTAYKMQLDAHRLQLLEEAVIRMTQAAANNNNPNQFDYQQHQSRPDRVPHPRTNLRMVLPTFHGTETENVVSWLAQIENVFRGERVLDDERRIAFAVSSLHDAAFEWYRYQTRLRDFPSWSFFVEELKRAFLPPNHQHIFRRQLKACRQTGTVQDYVYRFRSILGQIEAMDELDQVAHFIDGLKQQTALEIQYRCPDTLEDAITIAIMFDSARFGNSNNRLRGQNPIGVRHGFPRPHRGSRSMPSPMKLDAMAAPTCRQTAIKNRLCFRCNQPGHISRDCPNRRQSIPVGSGNGRE